MRRRQPANDFTGHPWQISYRTSAFTESGKPVDILHDFYIPALMRAVRYDRVAGYFRSSSLAAASQGFSAFVQQEGRARFIVGADLDPEDVRAILEGSEQRLAEALSAELSDPASWPDAVADGVRLLAWVVAGEHLDIRVAFRVHRETGEPLAADSVADGYVHMKWAVFEDAAGHRIYVSGSLNESRSALILNAENIDVHCDWLGQTERRRADQADAEFELLWEDRHPAFRVLTIPDAVRKKLIALAEDLEHPLEIDGTSALPKPVAPPSALERLRFAVIKEGPRLPGGRFVGLETAPVAPWPHQDIVARRLIQNWPGSFLLCDEVGLGKTIEAGLAIRSLYLSGLVKRVLVCAPAGLTQQWLREMAEKMLLPFVRALGGPTPRHHRILPVEQQKSAEGLFVEDLTIVSSGLIARKERIDDLRSAPPFDLVLVDEAHYLRRKNPQQGVRAHPRYGIMYRMAEKHLRKRTRSLLLATATPMQLEAVEVSDLIALTRRVGAFQFDPGLLQVFYDILGRLAAGERVDAPEWELVRRAVATLEKQDPLYWEDLQGMVIDGRYRSTVKQWLDRGRIPRGPDLKGVIRLAFAAAPLSRVMLRHTRALLEIYRGRGELEGTLAKRHVLPVVPVAFTHQEKRAYEALEDYCRELARRLAHRRDATTRSSIGFYLSFLRLRYASSLFAIRETLRRRLERVNYTLEVQRGADEEETDVLTMEEAVEEGDDDREVVRSLLKHREEADLNWERTRLKQMLENLQDLSGPSSKMSALLHILEQRRDHATGRIHQTVVFTRFFDTMTDIVQRIRQADPKIRIGTYSGQGASHFDPRRQEMVGTSREAVKHRFLRKEIDVLICTDAAAEGLNLQTADWLINFDLPWNPMKVEQRIGRIDRIGQENSDIYVANLCYVGSAEETVYGRLWKRLTETEGVVGTQQLSLLPVTREEFSRLAEDPGFADELEIIARKRVKEIRRRTASRELDPREIYDIYTSRLTAYRKAPVPVTLEDIWKTFKESRYLRELGVDFGDDGKKILVVDAVPGVEPGTGLTVSRKLYEHGLPGWEGRIHFASYGDPVFQAVLKPVSEFDLPPCVRRLEVTVPELEAIMVGYLAACRSDEGEVGCVLITRFKQLDEIELAEGVVVEPEEVQKAKERLLEMAYEQFQSHLAIPKIEVENEMAGRSQEILACLTIDGLIRARRRIEDADALFWRQIDAIERHFEDREVLRISRIRADILRSLRGLLFDVHVPVLGDEGYIEASRPLLKVAIDAACRTADSLKRRRSELTTAEVLSRLTRFIQATLKDLR